MNGRRRKFMKTCMVFKRMSQQNLNNYNTLVIDESITKRSKVRTENDASKDKARRLYDVTPNLRIRNSDSINIGQKYVNNLVCSQ